MDAKPSPGCETCESFRIYFDVADEIYESLSQGAPQEIPTPWEISDMGPLRVADLMDEYVAEAHKAAEHYGLPWPPHMPTAEELMLDMQNGRYHRDEHNVMVSHR
jgi:hypothetical protein